MIVEWWGYSAFVEPRLLNKISIANKWSMVRLNKWYLIGEECLPGVTRQSREVEPLAAALGMPIEEFRMRLERELRKGKVVMGIQCQDGILVHPSALALAVANIVKRETTVRKKTLLG